MDNMNNIGNQPKWNGDINDFPTIPDFNVGKMNRKGLRFAALLIGIGVTALSLSALAAQFIMSAIGAIIGGTEMVKSDWFYWLLLFVSEYIIAFPLAFLIIGFNGDKTKANGSLSFGGFVSAFFICIFAMYSGSLIGSGINGFIERVTGLTYTSPVSNAVGSDYLIIEAIILCVCAPVFEELLCRKFIIDRVRAYGEKTAIVLSALVFGLFHCTIEQIPYAFLLGLIFGYIYCKTGKIRYTMIMHSILNLLLGVIPGYFTKDFNVEIALTSIAEAGNDTQKILSLITPELIFYIAFVLVEILFAFVGFILVIVKIVNGFGFNPPERQTERKVSAAFFNIGMIVLYVVTLSVTAFNAAYTFGIIPSL